jgi:hypothetical protein
MGPFHGTLFLGSARDAIALNESLMNSIIAMSDRLKDDEGTRRPANLAWPLHWRLNGL